MTAVKRCAAVLSSLTGDGSMHDKARRVLHALGVHLDTDTDRLSVPRGPEGKGTLIVANHTSWLDIVALLAVEPVAFLAKREVREWPWVGRRADAAGTVFVDRWALRALPESVGAVADMLRSGRSVAAFPEATTWCAPPGGPFRHAVFQAALDAGAPVRPVSLSYDQAGEPSNVAAFVGDDTLAHSLGRVARAADLTVRVRALPALPPEPDRRALAHAARHAVLDGLPTPTSEAAHA